MPDAQKNLSLAARRRRGADDAEQVEIVGARRRALEDDGAHARAHAGRSPRSRESCLRIAVRASLHCVSVQPRRS